jgi:hypothetical protein
MKRVSDKNKLRESPVTVAWILKLAGSQCPSVFPVILILRNPKYSVSTKRKLLEPLITTFAVKYSRIRFNIIMNSRTYWIHLF